MEPSLKTSVLAVTVLAAGTVGAVAADLVVKAPVYKKAPVVQAYDWSGPYVGVNIGGSVGRSRIHTSDPGAIENETTYLSAIGAIGGGQIGYNWQLPGFYNLVVGVEADIQASGQRGSACLANCLSDGTISLNLQQKIDWFGTARARVGLTAGPVMSYVTAGLAYGHVQTSGSFVGFAPPAIPFALDENFAAGSSSAAASKLQWAATGPRRSSISTSISDNQIQSSTPGRPPSFSVLPSPCRRRRGIMSTAAASTIVSAATTHMRRRLRAGLDCTSVAT